MGLNATVTPGITVTSSTVLSAANLNLLGTPTVSITGSIDTSDIGADTIGSNQIIDGAVDADKIGNIGGANSILKGVDSQSSIGMSTSVIDSDDNAQISLLVNDTSELKARYITGHLDVSAATDNSEGDIDALNLTIKDNTITGDMLQSNAVQAHIGNIQPGGGKTEVGGKAANVNGGAGLIVFDPSAQDSIGDDLFYGKAKVLQPVRANQVLISGGGETSPLAFGTVPGVPDAFVNAYTPVYSGSENTTEHIFTKLFGSNVYGIRRENQLAGTSGYGVLLVVFEEGLFETGDNVGVMGNGINNISNHNLMPFVYGTVGLARYGSDLEILTSEEVPERPFVYVTWYLNTPSSGTIGENGVVAMHQRVKTGDGSPYLRNVHHCNMSFFKY